jgi:DNA-binding NtrC family response regulator
MDNTIRTIYIDDEANTEKFSSKLDIMKDEGIEVIAVTTVEQALPTIRRFINTLDIIILDIIMPPDDFYTIQETNGGTTTGLRLLADIRKEFPNIPIMIVSIRRQPMNPEILVKFNIFKYLEKPISASHIVEAIKDYLSTK